MNKKEWRFVYDEEIFDTLGSNFTGVISNGEHFLFYHICPDKDLKKEIMHIYSSLQCLFAHEGEEAEYIWTAENDQKLLDALNSEKDFSNLIGEQSILKNIQFDNRI